MSGLPILDVAIGLAFFYLVFALTCTSLNEALSRWFEQRPKTLEEAITRLLGGDNNLKNTVLSHPLIQRLSRVDKNGIPEKPSYIPAQAFATALLDHLTPGVDIRDQAALMQSIANLPQEVGRQLEPLFQKVNGDWSDFHIEIEKWYDNMMDRAEGWYKRYVQKQTYLLAVVIVLWTNFDTLHTADRLWKDSTLRSVVVEQAKGRVAANPDQPAELPLASYDNPKSPDKGKPVSRNTGPLTNGEQALLGSVTGWSQDIENLCSDIKRHSGSYMPVVSWFLMHILGWGVSIFAISLGAPFWFDTLNRFVNIRNAGRAPDEPRSKNTGQRRGAQ
jgi:hypothetical protein